MILDSELKTICITTWRRSDGGGIRAIRSRMLLRGMDSASCAAESRCPTFASSTGPLNTNSLGLTSNLRNLRPITAGFKNIVQKIGAGFAIYARAPNLGRVLEQLEITSEILDL